MKTSVLFLFLTFTSIRSFFYQIPTPHLKINKCIVKNRPLVIYKANESLLYLPDECRHMGSSLSKGWLNKEQIFCPYHGLGFTGNPVLQIEKDVYVSTNSSNQYILPYYPPEQKNPDFIKTGGWITIHKNQQIITENVLDMLHISYVHSFGRFSEMPSEISFQKTSTISGKSVFIYRPYDWTISNKVGKVQSVVVENEYHLPSTTITRVKAGKLIKTVMTRATPVSDKKTLFFYYVYRNFWKSETFPFLTVLGDRVMDILMERTIQEDIKILETVYDNRKNGFFTPYDITIKNYRKSLLEFDEMK